jgi:hypothetical protein
VCWLLLIGKQSTGCLLGARLACKCIGCGFVGSNNNHCQWILECYPWLVNLTEIALSHLDTQWGFRENTPVEAGGEFAYAGILIEELYTSQSQHLNHSHGASIQTLDSIQLHCHLQLRRALWNTGCCKHKTCLISLKIIRDYSTVRAQKLQTCAFFSKLELLERGKDRGLTEGQTMCLYVCKAVQILSLHGQTCNYYCPKFYMEVWLPPLNDIPFGACELLVQISFSHPAALAASIASKVSQLLDSAIWCGNKWDLWLYPLKQCHDFSCVQWVVLRTSVLTSPGPPGGISPSDEICHAFSVSGGDTLLFSGSCLGTHCI